MDDKSKKKIKLVFLKRDSYVKYIEQCIEEMNAEELVLDPTEEQQRRVFRLNRRKDLPDFLKFSCVKNPSCPKFFASIKLHKQPITARPIVERFYAPTYSLEKKLAAWCRTQMKGYSYGLTEYQPIPLLWLNWLITCLKWGLLRKRLWRCLTLNRFSHR